MVNPLKSDVNVTHVKGNVNEEEKRMALQIFTHFVSTREKSYGADVGQRLKLVEVNVWERDGQTGTGETVFETTVSKATHSTINPWTSSETAAKSRL
ncbi:hypothetical protein C0991_006883 [Blastosporella zonata]|nr:hypothetical protein C0991_006883 [Blastosporella zonata]